MDYKTNQEFEIARNLKEAEDEDCWGYAEEMHQNSVVRLVNELRGASYKRVCKNLENRMERAATSGYKWKYNFIYDILVRAEYY